MGIQKRKSTKMTDANKAPTIMLVSNIQCPTGSLVKANLHYAAALSIEWFLVYYFQIPTLFSSFLKIYPKLLCYCSYPSNKMLTDGLLYLKKSNIISLDREEKLYVTW